MLPGQLRERIAQRHARHHFACFYPSIHLWVDLVPTWACAPWSACRGSVCDGLAIRQQQSTWTETFGQVSLGMAPRACPRDNPACPRHKPRFDSYSHRRKPSVSLGQTRSSSGRKVSVLRGDVLLFEEDKRATTNVQNGLVFVFLFSFKKALILRNVLGNNSEKVWNGVEKCEKVWKTILPFSCCPLVFLWF